VISGSGCHSRIINYFNSLGISGNPELGCCHSRIINYFNSLGISGNPELG
jgi:hypothetical protein